MLSCLLLLHCLGLTQCLTSQMEWNNVRSALRCLDCYEQGFIFLDLADAHGWQILYVSPQAVRQTGVHAQHTLDSWACYRCFPQAGVHRYAISHSCHMGAPCPITMADPACPSASCAADRSVQHCKALLWRSCVCSMSQLTFKGDQCKTVRGRTLRCPAMFACSSLSTMATFTMR